MSCPQNGGPGTDLLIEVDDGDGETMDCGADEFDCCGVASGRADEALCER